MKALVLESPGQLDFREVQLSTLKEHEVKVAVKATLVCGSDKKLINSPKHVPVIPGHEFSGEVTEVSDKVDPKLLGKRVTVFPMFSCLKCEACKNNNHRDCQEKISLGFDIDGSFAEDVIVDERFLVPLLDELTYEEGALVEHLACAYNIAKDFIKREIKPSSNIVIIGDGPLALANILMLKQQGFEHIHVIGKHDNKLEFAKRLGAESVINNDQTNAFPIADIIIYSTPAKQTLDQVLSYSNKNAIVYPQVRISDQTSLDIMKEKNMTLARAFAYDFSDFDQVMKLIKEKRIPVNELISERLSLGSIKVDDIFDNRRNYKLLITP